MAWREWEGMKRLHFSISHPEQYSKPIRSTHTIERKTDTGEKVTHFIETFVLVI